MKSGYDQFFKQAQKVSRSDAPIKKQKVQIKKSQLPTPQPRGPKRRTTKAPLGILVVSVIGLFSAVGGYLHIEEVDRFMSRLEIQFLGQAVAQTAPLPPAAPAAQAPKAVENSGADVSGLDHLLKIKEKTRQLELKEEELARTEAELEAQKIALEKRIEELNNLRRDISSVLENKVKVDDAKVETLVQVYTNMKPVQAARVIETLDEDLAVEILNRMKKKSAADIMNMLKPEKAQIFSEKLAGFKR